MKYVQNWVRFDPRNSEFEFFLRLYQGLILIWREITDKVFFLLALITEILGQRLCDGQDLTKGQLVYGSIWEKGD